MRSDRDEITGDEIFRLLVESVQDYAIFALDAGGHVSTWNEGARRIKGYTAEEILGRHISTFYPQDALLAGKPERTLQIAAAEGRVEDEGYRVRRDGSVFWANVTITALRDPQGRVMGFAKVTRDLTERMRAQADLQARGEQLAEAEHIAQMGSWEWDLTLDRLRWSDELFRIYGLDPATARIDVAGFLDAVHADDRAAVVAAIERARVVAGPFEFEERIARPDGSVRTLRSRGRAVSGGDGAVVRLVGSCLDITEEKRQRERERLLALEQSARAEAEAAAARFRLLAEASEALASAPNFTALVETLAGLGQRALGEWCAVDLVASDGSLVRTAVAQQHAGVSRLNALPPLRAGAAVRVASSLPVEDDATAEAAEFITALSEAGFGDALVCPLHAAGKMHGVMTIASAARAYGPLELALGEELARRGAATLERARLVASLEESRSRLVEQAAELEIQAEELQQAMEMVESTNADLLRANDELALQTEQARQARDMAEAANQSKAQFLASMSHELRTPLNAIAGYAQLLELNVYGAMSEKQVQAVHRIQRNQRHLLGLINDILNFVKLDAGQVRFEVTDVRVAEALADVVPLVELQVRTRGLLYTWEPPDPTLHLRADRDRLDQVLLNLLSNAIKFTPAGGQIRVTSTADEARVHLRVADTGIGIPADKLDLIFEPFVQIGASTRRAETEGVGLGLAISRELVRGMGGDLAVSSEAGRGSTFTLSLPRTHPSPSASSVTEKRTGSSTQDRGTL